MTAVFEVSTVDVSLVTHFIVQGGEDICPSAAAESGPPFLPYYCLSPFSPLSGDLQLSLLQLYTLQREMAQILDHLIKAVHCRINNLTIFPN